MHILIRTIEQSIPSFWSKLEISLLYLNHRMKHSQALIKIVEIHDLFQKIERNIPSF